MMIHIIRNVVVVALALLGMLLLFSLSAVMIALGLAASVVTALYILYLRGKDSVDAPPSQHIHHHHEKVVIDADYEEVKKPEDKAS